MFQCQYEYKEILIQKVNLLFFVNFSGVLWFGAEEEGMR